MPKTKKPKPNLSIQTNIPMFKEDVKAILLTSEEELIEEQRVMLPMFIPETKSIPKEKTKEELIEQLYLYVETLLDWIRYSLATYDLSIDEFCRDGLKSGYDLVSKLKPFRETLNDEDSKALKALQDELARIDLFYGLGGIVYDYYAGILKKCESKPFDKELRSNAQQLKDFMEYIYQDAQENKIKCEKAFLEFYYKAKIYGATKEEIQEAYDDLQGLILIAQQDIKEGKLDDADKILWQVEDKLCFSYERDVLELYRPKEYEDLNDQVQAEQENCKKMKGKRKRAQEKENNYDFSLLSNSPHGSPKKGKIDLTFSLEAKKLTFD